jgi:glutamate synthase (NADPH) small chain
MDYGQEEAAACKGADPRQYLVMTERFLKATPRATSPASRSVEIEWGNDKGRFVPNKKEGTRRTLPAQLATARHGLPRAGGTGLHRRKNSPSSETDARSNIKANTA